MKKTNKKLRAKAVVKGSISVALSAAMIAGTGVPGMMQAVNVVWAEEDGVTEQCPTPEIYQPEGTVSLEGWMLATSSNNIKFGVDVNKNGGTRTRGYTYYYTTDGTEPSATNGKKIATPNVTKSTTGTEVDGVCTYKVIATKEGMKDSEVVTYTFKKMPTDNLRSCTLCHLR